MNKHLIIGYGEVGKCISRVLEMFRNNDVDHIDIGDENSDKYDYIHICFPYSDTFVEDVKTYVSIYAKDTSDPRVLIHSTVKPGTCKEIGANFTPMIGKHPHLVKYTMTFTKLIAGKDSEEIADLFEDAGISTRTFGEDKLYSLEAAKILSTTQYGVHIVVNKAIHKWCKENDADFDIVYNIFNDNYNKGYSKMDCKQFIRPILEYQDGKIGGHCVIANTQLIDSELTDLVKEYDDKIEPNSKLELADKLFNEFKERNPDGYLVDQGTIQLLYRAAKLYNKVMKHE